jgi:hypothetical protein
MPVIGARNLKAEDLLYHSIETRMTTEAKVESTPPLHGADAEMQVRVPALNNPGFLYDTIQADTILLLYGVTKRHALVVAGIQSVLFVLTMRRDILRVGVSELRVF